MTGERLSLALDAGAIGSVSPGRLAVFRPRAGQDLSALPTSAVQVIQGFRPDHDAFAAAGYAVSVAPEGRYDAALVCLPRAKAEARALIAEARARTDGPVLVDGQKHDGIDGLLRECRKRTEVGGPVSKAHGKLFWFSTGDFSDWQDPGPIQLSDGLVTRAGVFSADGPDRASELLAAALPVKLSGEVVDLGTGWGYLSRAILLRTGVRQLHLVEAEHAALECARQNIDDARAVFHWADATRFGPDSTYDVVVTNPPFHQSRVADPGLGRAFIATAARILKPSGRLWLVANRHLPYERSAEEHFRDVREHGSDSGFKILEAVKPRRGGR